MNRIGICAVYKTLPSPITIARGRNRLQATKGYKSCSVVQSWGHRYEMKILTAPCTMHLEAFGVILYFHKVRVDLICPTFGLFPYLFCYSVPSFLRALLPHVSSFVACYAVQVVFILSDHVADLLVHCCNQNKLLFLNEI